jgi:benzoyl-CoA reductase/2-hydroxyglutaryl-CoA dehydratase subunit BcrC/BadD/HgdB
VGKICRGVVRAGKAVAENTTRTCDSSTAEIVAAGAKPSPLDWFRDMVPHCLEYARSAKEQGHPIVGVMCEFTPRELIMAAGAVPVCLCGGSPKTIPSAEHDLPSNLCPIIKSTYGEHTCKTNPFLEMVDLIVAETTCDGKRKMYELLAQQRPMYVLELPHKADSIQSMIFWENELRRLRSELQERFGVEITNDLLHRCISVTNRERRLRRQLAQTMEADDPPLSGRQLASLRSCISGTAGDLRKYQEVLDWVREQPGGGYADRTRVLLTGAPLAHGAERVLEIIESSGGLVVCMENCTGVKAILEDVDEKADDPLMALAVKYFQVPCAVMTRNDRRLNTLRGLVRRYRPDCVVDLVWQACLNYDIESARIRELIEKELGLPFLKIETDYTSEDSARIAGWIEALFAVTRGKPRRR